MDNDKKRECLDHLYKASSYLYYKSINLPIKEQKRLERNVRTIEQAIDIIIELGKD